MRNIIPGDIIGDGYTCLSVTDSGYFAEKEMPDIGKVKVFIDKHTGMLHNVYNVGTVKPVDPSFGDILTTFNEIGLWKNSKYIVVGPYFNDYDEDPIIADLAKRLVNRKLFVYETIKDNKQVEDIKHRVSKQGYDLTYYVHVDMISQRPYAPYSGKNEKDAVWILKEDGTVIALEDASVIVQALIHAKVRKDQKIFYPESL